MKVYKTIITSSFHWDILRYLNLLTENGVLRPFFLLPNYFVLPDHFCNEFQNNFVTLSVLCARIQTPDFSYVTNQTAWRGGATWKRPCPIHWLNQFIILHIFNNSENRSWSYMVVHVETTRSSLWPFRSPLLFCLKNEMVALSRIEKPD